MLLILLILHSTYASILKEANSLYEEMRYQAESLVIRKPIDMLRQTLGLRSLDQDFDYHEYEENDKILTKQHRVSRILEEQQVQYEKPNPAIQNITVDEYYRQGPLTYIFCGAGQPILLNVTKHYCFKQRVSQSQYYDLIKQNAQNCSIRYRLQYGCLCHADYFGTQCLLWNFIVCDIEQPDKNCKLIQDEDYYNKKIDGNPPCFQFRGNTFIENVRTVCYNYDQTKLNHSIYTEEENYTVLWSNYSRGISALLVQQYKFNAPNPDDPNDPKFYIQWAASQEAEEQFFKYAPEELYFDTNQLKSTLPFNIYPYVRVTDWTYLSKSNTTSIDYNLTLLQLIGNEQIQVPIQPNRATSLFGRYQIDIGLVIKVYGFYSINQYANLTAETDVKQYQPQYEPKVLFFEDQLYSEPKQNDLKLDREAKIGLVIAIIFLILVLVLIWKYRNTICETFGPSRQERIHPEEQDNNQKSSCLNKCCQCLKKKSNQNDVVEPNFQNVSQE